MPHLRSRTSRLCLPPSLAGLAHLQPARAVLSRVTRVRKGVGHNESRFFAEYLEVVCRETLITQSLSTTPSCHIPSPRDPTALFALEVTALDSTRSLPSPFQLCLSYIKLLHFSQFTIPHAKFPSSQPQCLQPQCCDVLRTCDTSIGPWWLASTWLVENSQMARSTRATRKPLKSHSRASCEPGATTWSCFFVAREGSRATC